MLLTALPFLVAGSDGYPIINMTSVNYNSGNAIGYMRPGGPLAASYDVPAGIGALSDTLLPGETTEAIVSENGSPAAIYFVGDVRAKLSSVKALIVDGVSYPLYPGVSWVSTNYSGTVVTFNFLESFVMTAGNHTVRLAAA